MYHQLLYSHSAACVHGGWPDGYDVTFPSESEPFPAFEKVLLKVERFPSPDGNVTAPLFNGYFIWKQRELLLEAFFLFGTSFIFIQVPAVREEICLLRGARVLI